MAPISSIGWNNAWNYVRRAARVYPDVVFGTGGDVISSTLKDSFYGAKNAAGKRAGGKHFSGFWEQLKTAFKAGEKHNDALVKQEGGFWKAQWKAIKTTPQVIGDCWKEGGKAAEIAGKSKVWGNAKGLFKGLGKRLPIIGSAIMVLTELPNIVKATANEGIVSGAAETIKAGLRLGGGMLVGTIGAALGGPIGALVGYAIGDWLTSKVVGKSYSERKAEEKAVQEEQKHKMVDSPVDIPGYQQQYNPNNASYSSNTVKNIFDPSKMGSTLTPQQLAQMEMALARGAGLNLDYSA